MQNLHLKLNVDVQVTAVGIVKLISVHLPLGKQSVLPPKTRRLQHEIPGVYVRLCDKASDHHTETLRRAELTARPHGWGRFLVSTRVHKDNFSCLYSGKIYCFNGHDLMIFVATQQQIPLTCISFPFQTQ